MISLKAVIETVVEQGRRAILQATRPKINQAGNTKPPKLSEVQGDKVVCRSRPKSVLSNQHSVIDSPGSLASTSTAISSSGGGIVNLLRPVTSRIVQGLVRRVSSPLWTEARRRSAKRLFGETAPYFALVGVTLVSGPERGLLTAQDELEAICGDIREAVSRAGWIHDPSYWRPSKVSPEGAEFINKGFSLTDFEFGYAINKGCNAVVYAARWKEEESETAEDVGRRSTDSGEEQLKNNPPKLVASLEHLFSSERFWPLDRLGNNEATTSKIVDNDEFSLHSPSPVSTEEDEEADCFDTFSTDEDLSCIGLSEEHLELNKFHSLNSLDRTEFELTPSSVNLVSNLRARNSVSLCEDINLLLSSGGFQPIAGAVTRKRKKVKFKVENSELNSDSEEKPSVQQKPERTETFGTEASIDTYPLALKMMFNYEAESNAPAILTAMYKEMIPAKSIELDDTSSLWKNRLLNATITLPPHSNIVDMPCVFVDRIPLLADGLHLYPDALPKRINPSGYGRNMSLFCVMKRYDCTLAEYLSNNTPSIRTSLLLLTQLLEAVHHINKYNVAHRDLKADNVLLCLREGLESPHLVLSDFGCCLPDPSLCVSFSSYEADPRVGNAALMAPEIKSATPGMLNWLNYSRSDLWAVGTLAYEIFGLCNPFTSPCNSDSGNKAILDSVTYKEHQIPRLPKTVPAEIRCLIHDMLKRSPKQRPSPTVAATVCQLSLWGPRKWLNRHSLSLPSPNEVMRWLLCLSTKVICEAGSIQNSVPSSMQSGTPRVNKDTMNGQLEYEIVSTFLKRVRYSDIIQAIKWIRAF